MSPLFVAPPDVCIEAGRTLLYGLIPVTSAERSEEAQSVVVESDVVDDSMPVFLRPPGEARSRPIITSPITLDDVNKLLAADPDAPLTRFMQELRLMHFGWRLFDSAEGLATLLCSTNSYYGLPATRSHSAIFCIPSAAGLCCATTAAQHQSICWSSGRCQTPRSQTESAGSPGKG